MVDYAIKHEIPAIICAGDLFDKSRPKSDAAVFLAEQLRRLEDRKIQFLYVDGNHDKMEPSWAELGGWAESLHCSLKNVGGVKFTGLHHRDSDQWSKAVADHPYLDDADVFVGHQAFIELMKNENRSEASIADVRHVNTAIIGDYHKHLDFDVVNASGVEMLVLSPGSTCQQAIDEDAKKSFFLLYEDLSIASVPLKTRAHLTYDFLHGAEVDEFCTNLKSQVDGLIKQSAKAGYPESVQSPILWIRFNHTVLSAEDLKLIRSTAKDVGVTLFERMIKPKDEGDNDQLTEEEDTAVEAITLLDAAADAGLSDYAMSVVRALENKRSPSEIRECLVSLRDSFINQED